MGGVLLRSGRLEEAIRSFRRALELIPDFTEARHELGVALVRQGHPEEAMAQLEEALKEKPDFAKAHNDLGIVLLRKGRAAEAAVHFQRAIEITPGFAEAHYNSAVVYLDQRQLDQADGEFRKALELRPAYAEARYGLGRICYARNRVREALDHWFAALELMPDDLNSLKAADWVLAVNPDAAIRDGRKAVQLAESTLRLSGGADPAVLDIAAAAYAESAHYTEAVKLARQAATLAAQLRRPSLAEAAKARATLYESGNPYRDQRLP